MTGSTPNLLRRLFGARVITVEHASPEVLSLRYGRLRTNFDRASGQVHQNGKLVGVLGAVERIELHKPTTQEGMVNWFVTVRLNGARTIEVGQTTDAADASAIGARIATVTGRPVVVQP
jgi:hypothetical protein